jgi:CheY-like chemotaxis protein
MDGIEFIRRTKALAHRQWTPIIMLSASGIKREVRRIGANAFLRKPQDIPSLAEAVARLFARNQGQG